MGDLRLSNSSSYHLSISPDDIVIFHDYDSYTNDGDLALIRLSQDVVYNDYVRPACLDEGDANETKAFNRCVTTGWGDTETGGRPMCNELFLNPCEVHYQKLIFLLKS